MVFVPTLTGALMLKLLPAHDKWSRLAGLWLSTMLAPLLPLLLSFCASNTAGFTKKSVTLAMMFVGYCVGNFVGPQFFISTEAPGYKVSRKLVPRLKSHNAYTYSDCMGRNSVLFCNLPCNANRNAGILDVGK